MMKYFFWTALALALGWILFVSCMPMTVTLTFDDGLKSHCSIAAPMLEKHGWLGTFNVPTDFLGSDVFPLGADKAKDLCVSGVKSDFMTWEDAKFLFARGHEINSHTLDHADIEELFQKNNESEIRRQIGCSVAAIRQHLGVAPRYFCAPHNRCNRRLQAISREYGVELFNHSRRQFGRAWRDVRKFVFLHKLAGFKNLDFMMHGITKETGGYDPFCSQSDFASFLEEIARLEADGTIQVVPYSIAHSNESSCLFFPQRISSWISDLIRH